MSPDVPRPSPRDADAAGWGALRGSRAGVRLGAERLARLRLTPNPTPGGPQSPQRTGRSPKRAGGPRLSLLPLLCPHPAALGGVWGNCASWGGNFPLLWDRGGVLPVECGVGVGSPPWLRGWGHVPRPCTCVAASASFFGFFSCFSQIFPGFFPLFLFFNLWYKDQEQFQEVLCAYIYIYIYV